MASYHPQGLVVRQRKLQATQQGAWIQLGADFDGKAAYDHFGIAVSMSSDGTILAMGGRGDRCSTLGYVRVFKYASSKWTQLGADINGEAVDDGVGRAVSLSGDGTVLAVGAIYSDGNGDKSGLVQVYKYANNIWTQMGTDINGEAAGDRSGANPSVSLSSDGTVLSVGHGGMMALMALIVVMSGCTHMPIVSGLNSAPTLMAKLLVINQDGQYHCRAMALC